MSESMRHVVQLLRVEKSPAWLELSEVDDLIDRLLQHLGGLTEASLELYLASQSLMPATGSDSLGYLGTVHEQAGRLVNITAHLLTSFLELERRVESWEIGATHGAKSPMRVS